MFLISAGVTLYGGIFFLVFGSGERQKWDIVVSMPKDHIESSDCNSQARKVFEKQAERTENDRYNATAGEQEIRPLLNNDRVMSKDYRGTKSS